MKSYRDIVHRISKATGFKPVFVRSQDGCEWMVLCAKNEIRPSIEIKKTDVRDMEGVCREFVERYYLPSDELLQRAFTRIDPLGLVSGSMNELELKLSLIGV